jgi:mannose-6-phosphate isomerase-like protein (cupin superfamily)
VLIKVDDLPGGAKKNSSTFNGHEHGAQVSFFLSHNKPGTGPQLHKHPYEETFIVQEGDVLFTMGDEEIEAGPGDIIIVPANTPHKFLSRGQTHRQISIHPVARMETEWLE